MAGLKALVALAFTGSVGMTLLILGCALPQFNGNWYPFLNLIFYLLAVPAILVARNSRETMTTSNAKEEIAYFVATVLVISAFALPVVLARSPASEAVIQWGACSLTLFANVIVFGTIFGFFIAFGGSDSDYAMW